MTDDDGIITVVSVLLPAKKFVAEVQYSMYNRGRGEQFEVKRVVRKSNW